MPIINIKFIESVVATPEQKQQLIKEMTDTFVRILGEAVHPFTYVVIEETKMYDWGIAGHPQPDIAWLTGPEYAAIMSRAQEIMRIQLARPPAESQSHVVPESDH